MNALQKTTEVKPIGSYRNYWGRGYRIQGSGLNSSAFLYETVAMSSHLRALLLLFLRRAYRLFLDLKEFGQEFRILLSQVLSPSNFRIVFA